MRSMQTALCADLGGTKCRFGLVAADRSIALVSKVRTPRERGPFLAMLREQFEAIRAAELPVGWEPPARIGIGTAGVITKDLRSIVYAPNLPLDGVDVAALLDESLGLPCRCINDGRASALGEAQHAQAQGLDPLLVLFFGTGIGIGLLVGGQPYEGAQNAAGEVGHTLHIPDGYRCPCGRDGCFEAYCGGGPLTARARERLGEDTDGEWTVGDMVARRDAGDPGAAELLEEARVAAVALVANLCTLFNPAGVVLGGGVLEGWPELRAEIEAGVRRRCASILTEELQFLPAAGGSDAILWGAAAAAGLFES